MIETIARLYDSHEKALAAGQALVDAGFAGEQIALLSARGLPPDTSAGLDDAIRQAGIFGREAAACAGHIKRGAALLSVQAGFGSAGSAMRILNGFGPISLHQADPEPPARPVPSYDATPLSRIFNLPVLIDSPSRPIDVAIDVAPLSQALRLPLLLKEPAPLSRLLRVPALTDLF
jgi:hypothetical protein